jgi:hypothetical protein
LFSPKPKNSWNLAYSFLSSEISAVRPRVFSVLADDLEDLVLLEGPTRSVEREILRVDDTLDEAGVLGDEILAVVQDEDAAIEGSTEIENGFRCRQRKERSAYRLGMKRMTLSSS